MSNDILLLLQYLSVRGTPPGVSTDLFSQLPNEHVKKWSPIVMEGRLDQFKFPQPKRQRVKKTTLNAKNQQIKQKYLNHISFFAIGPPSGHVRITRLSSAEWTTADNKHILIQYVMIFFIYECCLCVVCPLLAAATLAPSI